MFVAFWFQSRLGVRLPAGFHPNEPPPGLALAPPPPMGMREEVSISTQSFLIEVKSYNMVTISPYTFIDFAQGLES